MRLAREAAPDAIRRLIELMASADERVAAVACNAILDRAFGNPKEYDEADDPEARGWAGEEAREKIMRRLDRLAAEHERQERERNTALIDEMARSTATAPATTEAELRERFARLMRERGVPL